MAKIKNKLQNYDVGKNLFDEKPNKDTVEMLKKAWDDLPTDFTMGDRSLFIEIAERLVKAADNNDRRIN
jgi:hypothetical protein